MERLTKRTNDGKVGYALLGPGECVDVIDLLHVWGDRLAAYEDIMTIERAQEFAQADKDGWLLTLPCKVGDTVYLVDYMTHSEALKFGVPQSEDQWQHRKYGRKQAKYLPLIVREKKMVKTLYPKIGKTVFLTREEAEAALKKKETDDETV